MLQKIMRNESKVNLGHQVSDPAVDNPTPTKQPEEIQLQRSKLSCGEGKASAPPDELTCRLPKPNASIEDDNMQRPNRKGFKCEIISRTVSPEKFECGSWASSAICRGSEEGGDSKHLYFDLPMELIRSSMTDDANAPVTIAFVFEKDCKGILKKNGSTRSTATATKPDASSGRHVRFSTLCPDSPALCISPRLLKAREDFTAFLEAQSN